MPKKRKEDKNLKIHSWLLSFSDTDKWPLKQWDILDVQVMKIAETDHPYYWRLSVDQTTFDNVIGNFNNKVYPNDVPINIWHDMSSKAQWRVNNIFQKWDWLFASIELTEDWAENLNGKHYKYFSIEIYDVYESQTTKKLYKDVVIWGAFTNYPYYTGMKKIVASAPDTQHIFTSEKDMNKLKDLLEKGKLDFSEKIQLAKIFSELTEEEQEANKEAVEAILEPVTETTEETPEGEETKVDVIEEPTAPATEAPEQFSNPELEALKLEVATLKKDKRFAEVKERFSKFALEANQIETFANLTEDQETVVLSLLEKYSQIKDVMGKKQIHNWFTPANESKELTDSEFASKVKEYSTTNNVDMSKALKEVSKQYTLLRK